MDDALSERMAVLDELILHGKEWEALRAIREEIGNLYGLVANLQSTEGPSRNEEGDSNERNAE